MSIDTSAIQNIIEYLQGSCKTISEACEAFGIEHEDINTDQLNEIYTQIFECTTCGWWHDTSEESESSYGEQICEECNND